MKFVLFSIIKKRYWPSLIVTGCLGSECSLKYSTKFSGSPRVDGHQSSDFIARPRKDIGANLNQRSAITTGSLIVMINFCNLLPQWRDVFFFQFLFSFDGEKITIILKDECWAKNYSSFFSRSTSHRWSLLSRALWPCSKIILTCSKNSSN